MSVVVASLKYRDLCTSSKIVAAPMQRCKLLRTVQVKKGDTEIA